MAGRQDLPDPPSGKQCTESRVPREGETLRRRAEMNQREKRWFTHENRWFMVIYGDLWWFMVIYGDLWWFMVIYGDLPMIDPWKLGVIYETLWRIHDISWVFLGLKKQDMQGLLFLGLKMGEWDFDPP